MHLSQPEDECSASLIDIDMAEFFQICRGVSDGTSGVIRAAYWVRFRDAIGRLSTRLNTITSGSFDRRRGPVLSESMVILGVLAGEVDVLADENRWDDDAGDADQARVVVVRDLWTYFDDWSYNTRRTSRHPRWARKMIAIGQAWAEFREICGGRRPRLEAFGITPEIAEKAPKMYFDDMLRETMEDNDVIPDMYEPGPLSRVQWLLQRPLR